jgi:signal transduction histidine kinase
VSVRSANQDDELTAVRAKARVNEIFGSGEMADRTRSFDWSKTAAGPVEDWPEALLTTVNTLLSSKHPMFLWWGKDLVQFYNDGYRPSIREDKHPKALGQQGPECWAEIWHIIGPEIEAVMTQGEASWHEDQLVPINRNGRLEDVYWTYGYSPVRASTGEICGTLVVCTETTGSVLAKRQMQQEKERLADLFQQAPAFFAVLGGPKFVFEMMNPQYEDLLGRRDLLGMTVLEAVPEAEGQGFIGLLNEVYLTGKPYVGRGTPLQLSESPTRPAGIRYLDFVYQPRRDADGTISGIIVLGVDVTESKKAEQSLMQSEKLAVVGRLASSIAHEMNNPLESVTNLLFLAQQTASNPDTKQYLSMAEVELRRVSAITNQTLRFYRQTTRPRPATAHELVEATVPLFQGRLVNSQVKLEQRDRTRQPILCFDGEIRQVLSNLIGNAIDAMSGTGGRLLVRSRDATDWRSGRRGVVLTVADTGPGMSRATIGRIFEPFFTTKGISGTGLGLWISKEIVDRHKGRMRVRSNDSDGRSGTVFTLFLPCDGEAVE